MNPVMGICHKLRISCILQFLPDSLIYPMYSRAGSGYKQERVVDSSSVPSVARRLLLEEVGGLLFRFGEEFWEFGVRGLMTPDGLSGMWVLRGLLTAAKLDHIPTNQYFSTHLMALKLSNL